jgi:hypothetical protein
MGRTRADQAESHWPSKLHPVFIELAKLNGEFEIRFERAQQECKRGLEILGAETPGLRDKVLLRFKKKIAELDAWVGGKLLDIDKRYQAFPYNSLAYSYLALDPPVSIAEGIFEWLHFLRHRESIQATPRKDAQGDPKAWDKLSRTEKDLRILAFGKGRFNPVKCNVIHRQLLELVIAFENEHLTADELAECFNKYCACGKQDHGADTLEKLRARLETELKACSVA